MRMKTMWCDDLNGFLVLPWDPEKRMVEKAMWPHTEVVGLSDLVRQAR